MKVGQRPTIGLEVVLVLNEDEARAVQLLSSYGVDAFIAAFKSHLGGHYLSNYEKALRTFLKTSGDAILPLLASADEARKAFEQSQGATAWKP